MKLLFRWIKIVSFLGSQEFIFSLLPLFIIHPDCFQKCFSAIFFSSHWKENCHQGGLRGPLQNEITPKHTSYLTVRKQKKAFPGGSDCKESACSAGDLSSIPGWGRSPGEANGYSLQDSCLENSMDRGAWQAGYSPWGHKESDTTRPLTALSNTYQQKKPVATRLSEP